MTVADAPAVVTAAGPEAEIDADLGAGTGADPEVETAAVIVAGTVTEGRYDDREAETGRRVAEQDPATECDVPNQQSGAAADRVISRGGTQRNVAGQGADPETCAGL